MTIAAADNITSRTVEDAVTFRPGRPLPGNGCADHIDALATHAPARTAPGPSEGLSTPSTPGRPGPATRPLTREQPPEQPGPWCVVRRSGVEDRSPQR